METDEDLDELKKQHEKEETKKRQKLEQEDE